MDNKHRKLFVTRQSNGCKLMPKMHAEKYLWRPGSAWTCWGSLCAPPGPTAAMEGPLLREGRGGKGAYL